MSLWSRLTGAERRAQPDPYIAHALPHRVTTAGLADPSRASGLPVAQACISTIAQSLASVPLNLYRHTEDGGRERATDRPLFGVLHDQPNDQTTAFEFHEFMVTSMLVTGNAYAVIDRNGRGQVTALHPVHPSKVSVEQIDEGKSYRLRYRVATETGAQAVYLNDEILHLRYRIGPDGIMGIGPIQLARETFDLALEQQQQAQRQAQNAFRTEGVLVFPSILSAEQFHRANDLLEEKLNRVTANSGIMVLDAGAEFKGVSMSARDAEFLDSRKLTNLDIARLFNVPPTVAGITDHATYSNVDGESRALVVRCLAPMAKRIEQAMTRALLSTEARRDHFIEHDLSGLLRGDLKSRYEAYRIGREWGWLSQNDIRTRENLPKITGGDDYLTPLNMTSEQAPNEGNQ